MSAAVITASASILVAVLAFILNQRGQIRLERRQAQLARVNSQLRDLYGPLNALVRINEQIWKKLREEDLPSKAERRPGLGNDNWKTWRDSALMPANYRMRDLVVEHADLLLDSEFPQVLSDFCAHVSSQEVALAFEARGGEAATLIGHPGSEFAEYVRGRYRYLKNEQARLLKLVSQ